MSYTATTIANEIEALLNDSGNDIWTAAQICSFVSEAQHLIVSLRPDANAVTEALTLATTSKQSIPAGGVKLLDVIANTSGAPIQKITRERMTDLVSAWTTETGTAVEFFMFDEENPTVFWVYPKPASAISIDIMYSVEPDLFDVNSTDLGISDVYISAIYDHVLYRCLSMHTKGADFDKAAAYQNSFYSILGVKVQNEAILNQIQSVGAK